jgi:hypothetical protein
MILLEENKVKCKLCYINFSSVKYWPRFRRQSVLRLQNFLDGSFLSSFLLTDILSSMLLRKWTKTASSSGVLRNNWPSHSGESVFIQKLIKETHCHWIVNLTAHEPTITELHTQECSEINWKLIKNIINILWHNIQFREWKLTKRICSF